MENKGLGIGLIAVGGSLIALALIKKKPGTEPPTTDIVSVSLKNAPTTPILGDTLVWGITIHNQARTQSEIIYDVPLTQSITFEDVPQDWFPLPVFILVYWLPARSQIGTYNSWRSDFAGWMGEVYIPSFGDFTFDCNTRMFGKR